MRYLVPFSIVALITVLDWISLSITMFICCVMLLVTLASGYYLVSRDLVHYHEEQELWRAPRLPQVEIGLQQFDIFAPLHDSDHVCDFAGIVRPTGREYVQTVWLRCWRFPGDKEWWMFRSSSNKLEWIRRQYYECEPNHFKNHKTPY